MLRSNSVRILSLIYPASDFSWLKSSFNQVSLPGDLLEALVVDVVGKEPRAHPLGDRRRLPTLTMRSKEPPNSTTCPLQQPHWFR
jgi:hypothetical protein